MHKNTLKLRINFNQISDDINLEKMKELEDRLKNEKAI